MALSDLIALDREAQGWAIVESAFATEVKPASANQFFVAGEVSPKQSLGFIEDMQRRNTYSQASRFAGRYEPGAAQIPIYIKPAALGVAPEGNEFLQGLFGRETIAGGASVTYALQRTIDSMFSYTVWIKTGHFVYRLLGSIVDKGTFPLKADNSNDALSQGKFDLIFAEMRWTGTDEANTTIGGTPQAAVIVFDAKKFTIGSYVEVGAQNNAGAGYQVTAVNYSTSTLTLSPTIANVAVGHVVKPWIPPAIAEVGVSIHGRLGSATIGGVNMPIVGGEIMLENNFKMLNEEKNGLNFANRAVRKSVRKVSVKAEVYFDANQAKFFYNALNQVRGDFFFPWGTTAAARFKLTAKNVEFDAPDVAGSEEKILTLNGQAFASTSLDDELVGLLD